MRTRAEEKADKTLEDLARRIGITLLNFERRIEQLDEEGVQLRRLSIRLPTEEKPDYLITIGAVGETSDIVAFHGGVSLAEALRGALERIYNRSLKWRDDEYK